MPATRAAAATLPVAIPAMIPLERLCVEGGGDSPAPGTGVVIGEAVDVDVEESVEDSDVEAEAASVEDEVEVLPAGVLVDIDEDVEENDNDDDDDAGGKLEAAARIRSPYWMLQRTRLVLATALVAQLVRRGQHACAVPSARMVQGTELSSSQAEGWST